MVHTMLDDNQWVAPDWFDAYRDMIHGTGGRSVEYWLDMPFYEWIKEKSLVQYHAGVVGQVSLLVRLHEMGLLKERS